MPKLTKRNYFTKTNNNITNSKLKDFVLDRHYFYKKHILHTIKDEQTDSLLRGKCIDMFLTEGEKKFRSKFIAVSRRSKKDGNYEYQVPLKMYEEIEAICRKAMRQDIYKELKKYKKQVILQREMPIGKHFVGMAGMLDYLLVKGKEAVIYDLKSTTDISPTKYFYKCQEFAYHRQMAFYQILVKYNFPEVEEIKSYHWAIECDTKGIYNSQVFELDQLKIEEEKQFIFETIDELKKETKFPEKNCSSEGVVKI